MNILIIAEGATSRSLIRNRDADQMQLSVLADAAKKSSEILGVTNLSILDLPDNRLDSLDRLDIIKIIESHVREYQSQIVYCHHSGDVNIDHRILHEAVVTACRPLPDQSVKSIYSFEVQSSTEWQPPALLLHFNLTSLSIFLIIGIKNELHLKPMRLKCVLGLTRDL